MRAPLVILALAASAAACEPPPPALPEFPAPDAWGGTTGPGLSGVAYAEDALHAHCAYLPGGPGDAEHHNLVVPFDGLLWMPWSPEDGGGGLTAFDFSEPCAPVKVGEGEAPLMRESHTLSVATRGGRDWVAVDAIWPDGDPDTPDPGGIGIWDVTDPSAPRWAADLRLPGSEYPDAYLRVTLSTFWMGDVLYVAGGFNGVFLVDVSDPEAPSLLGTHTFEPGLLVGTVHAIGPVAMVSSAGDGRTALLDLSDPADPRPIAGGDFTVTTRAGEPTRYYFANVSGRYGLFARNLDGGGPVVFDISTPSAPRVVGDAPTAEGNGGYVFGHEDRLFLGDSEFGSVYDFSDPATPTELHRYELRGDFDTLTPVGNVAVASVDAGAAPGRASAVIPWRAEPDARGPRVGLHFPKDGAAFVAPTSPIGLSFDEMVEPRSVFAGSFRVWIEGGDAVSGRWNSQENLVVFTPDAPWPADATVRVQLPAGGITDASGNPIEEGVAFSFRTGA